MAIVAGDLKAYAAANMVTDDTSTVGGAIDTTIRVTFTDIAANDSVECVSDNAGDTMNITVVGRDSAGDIVTETKALNGVTFITLSTMGAVTSVNSAICASSPAGTVTVRRATGDTTIGTIDGAAGEVGFVRLFRQAASDAGATKTRYEKFFIKNTHASIDLTSAVVAEVTDSAGVIACAIEDAVDDTGTATNRLTAPAAAEIAGSGFTISGATTQALADELDSGADELGFGSAIGIWVRQSLTAGHAAINEAYSIKITGNTVA